MEDAFGVVLWVVVIVAAIVAVATFAKSGETYRQIGTGGLSLNEDRDHHGRAPASGPPPSAAAQREERDDEIRQMLEARNAHRARKGQAPLDVEHELHRLTAAPPAAPVDAGLREEVRQLVLARNERRVRRGKAPLDVEAEVERQLRELG